MRATNHAKRKYKSVISSGYGPNEEKMDSKRIRMEAAASIELECLNDTSSSLK